MAKKNLPTSISKPAQEEVARPAFHQAYVNINLIQRRSKLRLSCVIIFALICLFPQTGNAVSNQLTECKAELSPDLLSAIERNFPNLTLPDLSDLDPQSIDYDLKGGGNGCYVVGKGDFDGKHHEDFALLLLSKKDKIPHLIVALHETPAWSFYELPAFCESIKYCYVKSIKLGTYLRSEALSDMPNRPGEQTKIASKNESILVGTLESTGVVYVFSDHAWSFVLVSD